MKSKIFLLLLCHCIMLTGLVLLFGIDAKSVLDLPDKSAPDALYNLAHAMSQLGLYITLCLPFYYIVQIVILRITYLTGRNIRLAMLLLSLPFSGIVPLLTFYVDHLWFQETEWYWRSSIICCLWFVIWANFPILLEGLYKITKKTYTGRTHSRQEEQPHTQQNVFQHRR